MNPITLVIDGLTILACALALSGCGQADPGVSPTPDSTPAIALPADAPIVAADVATQTPPPTATPTPSPTLVTYIYQNITICSALHNWDPNTTTIKTYPTAGNSESGYYLFRWDGVVFVATGGCEAGCTANVTLTRSDIHGVVCTITVSNGQLTGVTP